jgi:hypothetical protein
MICRESQEQDESRNPGIVLFEHGDDEDERTRSLAPVYSVFQRDHDSNDHFTINKFSALHYQPSEIVKYV